MHRPLLLPNHVFFEKAIFHIASYTVYTPFHAYFRQLDENYYTCRHITARFIGQRSADVQKDFLTSLVACAVVLSSAMYE